MDELQGLEGMVMRADSGAIELDAPVQDPQGAQAAGGAMVPMGGPDYAMEAAGIVDMFAAMACGYAPAAGEVWTPEAKQRTAAALVPVLQKYGVSLGAMPPELMLAIVAGPLLWQTAKVMAAQAAQDKREREAARTVEAEPGAARIVPQAGAEGAPDAAARGPAVHPQMALYRGQGG